MRRVRSVPVSAGAGANGEKLAGHSGNLLGAENLQIQRRTMPLELWNSWNPWNSGKQKFQHRPDSLGPRLLAVRRAFVLGVMQIDALRETQADQRRFEQARVVQAPAAL